MSQSSPATNQVSDASPAVRQIEADIREDIAQGKLKLPVLPNVATEVLASTLDDTSDAVRLAGLIQQDQSLATHVLRVVNSPAFRGSAEIVSLQQAIARLGMVRIREIALTASLKNALSVKGAYQDLMDDAWRYGLAAGLWSKEVARATRKNVEQAYVDGLLHNIGQSLIAVDLARRDPTLASSDAESLMRVLGRDAGIALVEEWQLPPSVAVVIEHIGQFASAGDQADDVAVVEAGSVIAHAAHTDAMDAEQILANAAVQHLNLYPDDVTALLEHADAISNALSSMVL